jgi:large subunit ribosomal protein L15
MPLQRRVPKRGFKNPFRTEYEIVNVSQINKLTEDEITPELLHSYRLIDIGKGNPVKILGDGEITRKVTIRAHAITDSARAKIEAAGGSVELLES